MFIVRRITLLLVAATGCAMGTAKLGPPAVAGGRTDATVWGDTGTIGAGQVRHPQLFSHDLTSSLIEFVETSHAFRATKRLPGKPRLEDRILRFSFPQFRQRRAYHP